jgi:hypothetical protein
VHFILSLVLLFSVTVAQAQEKITPCAWRTAKGLSEELNKTDLSDKIKHCSVTCLVTLQCSRFSARSLGLAKEFADLLGMGQAEIADLAANELGIDLALKGRATSATECRSACSLYY